MVSKQDLLALNLFKLHQAENVFTAFVLSDVEFLVYKGAALIDLVYDPHERSLGDIDILVPKTQRAKAVSVLESIGFRRLLNNRRPLGQRFSTAGEWVSPGGGHIDLHTNFAQRVRWPVRYDQIAERSESMVFGKLTIQRPCSEELILCTAIDEAKDEYAQKMTPAKDIARVAEKMDVDWDRLVQRARLWRCTVPAWWSLEHARVREGAQVPQKVMSELRPSNLRQWYLRRFLNLKQEIPYQGPCTSLLGRRMLLAPVLTDSFTRFMFTAFEYSLLRIADVFASRFFYKGERGPGVSTA